MQSESNTRYHKGWLPIRDTYWKVKTLEGNQFVTIGKIKVSGRLVAREMDSHMSIKGYEPYDIAKRMAARKFRKQLRTKGTNFFKGISFLRPVIVEEIHK